MTVASGIGRGGKSLLILALITACGLRLSASPALGGGALLFAWLALAGLRFSLLAAQLRPHAAALQRRGGEAGAAVAWERLGRVFVLRLAGGALVLCLGRGLRVLPVVAAGLMLGELVRVAIALRGLGGEAKPAGVPRAPLDPRQLRLLAARGALELAGLALFLAALAGLAGSWPLACGALFLGGEASLHLAMALRGLRALRAPAA